MKDNKIIGGSVLPITNFIMRTKIADDFKPEYEPYDNGFYLAIQNIEEFIREHLDKDIVNQYILSKELVKVKKELSIEKIDIVLEENKYITSKKYRQYVKNKIFDKKIEILLSLKERKND